MITLDRKTLRDALSALLPFTARPKAAKFMPVLASVRFEAGSDQSQLQLSATTLDTAFRLDVELEAPTEEPVDALAPAASLASIAGELPAGPAKLAWSKKGGALYLHVQSARSKFKLPTMAPSSFPTDPFRALAGDAKAHEVPAGVLHRALTSALYAASRDQTRPNLSAVHLAPGAKKSEAARVEATDGHRFARASVVGLSALPEILVPVDTAAALARVLNGRSEAVRVSVSKAWLSIELPEGAIAVRLSEERFPSVDQVLPPSYAWAFTADRAELLEAVRRAATLAPSDPIALDVSPGEVRITTKHHDTGSTMTHRVSAETTETLPDRVGMNVSFLVDALEALDDDRVTLEGNDQTAPVQVRAAGAQPQPGAPIHVIMPMQPAGLPAPIADAAAAPEAA